MGRAVYFRGNLHPYNASREQPSSAGEPFGNTLLWWESHDVDGLSRRAKPSFPAGASKQKCHS